MTSMKVIGRNDNINMVILALDTGEKLPDKVMIIINDYSVTFEQRKTDP